MNCGGAGRLLGPSEFLPVNFATSIRFETRCLL